MFAKYVTAGLVGSALLATAALAQTPAATTTAPAAPVAASDSSYQGNWRASKVVGLSVYNDSNESLGSINDLLLDKSGNIKGVVVGVGGFLGVGEHLVAVSFDKIKFVDTPVVTTTASNGAPATSSGVNNTRPIGTTTTTGAATGTVATSAATTTKNPWYPDHALLSATKDELKNMIEFKYTTQ
jgi:sporulation protein YlmC with PRC-barrel domain